MKRRENFEILLRAKRGENFEILLRAKRGGNLEILLRLAWPIFLLHTAGLGQNFFYIRLTSAMARAESFLIYGWPRPGPAFFLYTSGQGQLFKKYTASQGTGQGHFFFTYGWPGPKILLYTVAVLKLSNGLGQLWHVQYTFMTFFL